MLYQQPSGWRINWSWQGIKDKETGALTMTDNPQQAKAGDQPIRVGDIRDQGAEQIQQEGSWGNASVADVQNNVSQMKTPEAVTRDVATDIQSLLAKGDNGQYKLSDDEFAQKSADVAKKIEKMITSYMKYTQDLSTRLGGVSTFKDMDLDSNRTMIS
jgi:hypothetical protein